MIHIHLFSLVLFGILCKLYTCQYPVGLNYPPKPKFYELLKTISSTKGLNVTDKPIDFSIPGGRGLILSPFNQVEDFSIYAVGKSKATCDAQWSMDPSSTIKNVSGNCISTQLTDYFIQCRVEKGVNGDENWLYVSFGKYINWYIAYGDTFAGFVPTPIGQPQKGFSFSSQQQQQSDPAIISEKTDASTDLTQFVEIVCPPYVQPSN